MVGDFCRDNGRCDPKWCDGPLVVKRPRRKARFLSLREEGLSSAEGEI